METTLYKKLLIIQKHINGLAKDKAGPMNNYRYVTGDKLLENVKPLMNDNGILLKQEILSIDNERQNYTTSSGKDKNEILSKVMMRFTWIDTETGEKDENLFGANGQNDWDKGVGSALTYAERYFLLKYFHIATDEDDIDNPDRKPEDEAAAPKAKTEAPAHQKPTDDNKKWLNQKTPEWAEAIKYLQTDGASITKIETKYKLSKENKAKLIEEAQEVLA